jgi:trans-aconitate 2-methyltransferase
MTEESRPDYAFGDNATAGDRLALLGEVFEPSSESLLRHATLRAPALALDVGCGPGYTTALLASATGATRTVGLDASEAFVRRAREQQDTSLEFAVHDVTRTPFPVPPADMVFARFVLAHLQNPTAVIHTWCSLLAPGGRLVTDETERIETTVETFASYEATARSMIAHYGADLQVGALIRDLPAPSGTRVLHSEIAEVRPRTATVARLYGMNLTTWKHDPFIVQNLPIGEIDRLERELAALALSDGSDELSFHNRQVVYERV